MKLFKLMLASTLLLSCQHDIPVEPEPNGEIPPPQWPMFRHGVRHTGNVNNDPYEGIMGPEGPTVSVKWAYDYGSRMVGSAAIAGDGTIYFGTAESGADSVFHAINPDGTPKWRFDELGTEGTWSSPAIADDGTIYCISRGGFFALHPDGSLKWQLDTGIEGPSSLALGPDGTIYWCNSQTFNAVSPDGVLKWQLAGGNEFHHPVVDRDGTVYYNYRGRGSLVAVNPDGSVKWEFEDVTKFTFDSGIIDGDGTIYFFAGGSLYAVDNAGRLKWKIHRLGGINGINVPALAPDHTILVAGLQYLYAFLPDGEEKWKSPIEEASSPPTVDAAGNVYLTYHSITEPRVTCFSSDGSLKWQTTDLPRATGTGGTPLGPDGSLYFGFYRGVDDNLYALH